MSLNEKAVLFMLSKLGLRFRSFAEDPFSPVLF